MSIILGYLALFAGCFLEGETSLLAASFAAHRGMLEIIPVFLVAYVSTQMADWTWFLAGRRHGKKILEKKPKWNKKLSHVHHLIHKYPILILMTYRFLYGMRSIIPLTVGMSAIPYRKFLIFSLISTFIWAITVCSAGYFFGAALEANMSRLKEFEIEILVLIILIGVIVGLIVRRLQNRKYSYTANEIQS
jgi:membrane protein DedA with SNARE-associated domain